MAATELLSGSSPARQPVKIRPAQAADASAIAELGAYVYTKTFGHSVPDHELQAFLEEEYTPLAISKDIQNPNKDIIVAVDAGGKVVGFAYLTRGTSEPCIAHMEGLVELQRIYLHPSVHGTGLASRLRTMIEDMAMKQGFKNIWLGVWEENARAQRVYKKWGYRKVGEHDFLTGKIIQTDDILVKSL